ncbi:hypothetical protein AAY72_15580 [Alishewanella sp. WH16-1]|jgi:hypothetical protein|uniref:hypothetical protein n=1 Tax=Alishewanella sp. WH16-1 TaxID=1651088 RepID=UPI00070C16E7|nr:hypothetical protein [Alishewanella sp. WH16-1]KRS20098.1 hypothetical protein AAY72_15580 [Alishewanella sp. WH16-1]
MTKDPKKQNTKPVVPVEPQPAKVAPKMVKRRQKGDFWINLSIALFISVCLLILGFELLIKIAG